MQLSGGGTQARFAKDSPVKGTYQTGYTFSLGISPGIIAFATNNMARRGQRRRDGHQLQPHQAGTQPGDGRQARRQHDELQSQYLLDRARHGILSLNTARTWKRIILSILSVFITLGAAAETGQALPAVQRAATAAVEETPPATRTPCPRNFGHPRTGTEATAETASGLAAETGTAAAAGHPRRPGGTLGADARSHAGRKAQASPGGAFPAHAPPHRPRDQQTQIRLQGRSDDGLTASYGTVSSDDTDLMLIFDNIDADATIATVKTLRRLFLPR